MADPMFVSWRRRGGHAIGTAPVGGRPAGTLKLTATDSSGGSAGAEPSFLLYGPGDVTGLRPGAVTARYPRPGQIDAEPTYRPYVELAEPDLPWRYSPRGEQAGAMLPWLALLAVKPDEIERVGPRVLVTPAAFTDHPVSDASAHVQQTGDHEVGRVL